MTDELQGAIDEIEGGRYVEAFGNKYEVADKVALMPLLEYAHLAQRGLDTRDMEAMSVLFDLLRTCFTADAWARFKPDSVDARADDDELVAIVGQAIEVIASVPPTSPTVSSDGPPPTSESSTESSSSEPAEESFEARKRALGLVPVMEAAFGQTG